MPKAGKKKKVLKAKRPKAKPAKKTAPRPISTRRKILFPETGAELMMKKAQQRSFITEGELLYAFPDLEDYLQEVEDFLAKLELLGLRVVENTNILGE
ncbi:MAG: hypothetical protein AAB445_04815, partial [Patescibacteria group bacterium]